MASEKALVRVLDLLTSAPSAQVESLADSGPSHARNLRKAIDNPNIVAVGVGEKISKGKPTGKLALRFYVMKKVAPKKLRGDAIIPPAIPESVGGSEAIPTDVIVLGKLKPEVNAVRRPLQPGNSIGHVRVTAGTLGAVVRKGGKNLLLSNSHVLARGGLAKKGDSIIYPGKADGGAMPADHVANLTDFGKFKKGGAFLNRVDCAIAEPLSERLKDLVAEIKGVGLPKGTTAAVRGMKVTKVGRTTGKTTGEVQDVNFRFVLNYDGVGQVGFTDQVLCSRYTDGGDSGSLVIDKKSGRAVGLHFAGANGGSVFNPIDDVLKELGVSLVTKPLNVNEAASTKRLGRAKQAPRKKARRRSRSK